MFPDTFHYNERKSIGSGLQITEIQFSKHSEVVICVASDSGSTQCIITLNIGMKLGCNV